MADFCNFCYYNDIDYEKIINNKFDLIIKTLYEEPNPGKTYIHGGVCEGCGGSGIILLKKEDVFEIYSVNTETEDSSGYLGKLVNSSKKNLLIEKVNNHNHWLIDIDEDSYLFKTVYSKKKKLASISKKTMLREFEAAKHIAYALYMIGDKPGYVSLHDCVSFEDFDVDIMKAKKLNDKAWGLLQYYYQNEYEYEKYKEKYKK